MMIKRFDVPILTLGLVLLGAALAAGQTQMVVPSGPGQSQPQFPPRDGRPAAVTGTAMIRGRVVAGDTGRPLRRARIRLMAPELGPEGRTTSTNLDGRYELKELPPGRYTVQATRSGYLQLQYGQRRPLEQGQPLQLADKQVLENVDFALPKTSLITGRITDELGDPVAGAQVFAMRSTFWQGHRRLTPAGFAAPTDDLGQYRITGLAPGSYFVMSMLRDTWTVSENGVESTLGYAQTYFPGTAGPTNARRITIGVGQEASTTDFSLVPGRAAEISGRALDSTGVPLASRTVALMQELAGPTGAMLSIANTASVAADGAFAFKNVPPGEYKLRSPMPGPQMMAQEAATLSVVVDGVDITGLTLMARTGWSFSGRVVMDGGGTPTVSRDRMRLAARLVDGDTSPMPPGPGGAQFGESGRVKADWTFAVTGVFGPARLRATLPDGWAVKAMLHDGTDISDTAMEMRGGEALTDVEVVLTDRVSTVSGQLTDARGGAVVDGTVIVFAEEEGKWAEDSRWVRTARPDQQGRYQVKGLPAGRYYAIAVDYVEDGMWNDPEFLASIEERAQKFTLLDAGSQSLSLKMVTP